MTKDKSFENISKKHYELLIKAMPEYKDSCLKAVDKLLNVAFENKPYGEITGKQNE